MAFDLVTFLDIQNAVAEELKLSTSDTVEIARIKRDINLVYINSVAPAKRWPWLRGNANIEHKPYLADGTVACTPNSTTITFSTGPTTSKAGYLFAINTFSEVYQIASHTSGSVTAVLTSPFTGTLQTAATYKIWSDTIVLPVDCRETIEVYHSFFRTPMEPVGLQEFRRRVTDGPFTTGRPEIYSTYDYVGDEDATRYRVMKVHPSLYSNSTTLTVDYTREIASLDLDDDEPVMPIEDRSVLLYGALERAWKRLRNTEASEQSKRDFQEKLAQMAGRVEDSQDQAQVTPSSQYLAKKRGRSINKSVSATGSGTGSYTAPSYLQNAVIEGAQVTANITVNSGITIDGVDVSVLSSDFSAHLADTADAHDASAISFSPTGTIAATDVQSAIAEVSGDVTALETAAGIVNVPSGNLTSTNVQAALDELQTDVDTRATDAALTTHAALTAAHGATGAVVGTTNTQTLTNKTLTSPIISTISNTGTLTLPTSTDTLVGKATTDVLTNKSISGATNTLTAIPLATAVSGQLPIGNGGTGQATKAAGFDALSPMTTGGDLIYGGASGTGTRLANGAAGTVLTSSGTTLAPTWSSVAAGNLAVTASKTTTYSISGSDNVVLTDASGGSFTVTLPTAVGVAGKIYTVKRTDQTLANAVTIATTSSQTIDGVTTRKVCTQYEEFTVVSDGANWTVTSHTYPKVYTAYTPVVQGLGTIATVEMFWFRDGDSIILNGNLTSGTLAAAELQVGLPSGLTSASTTKIPSIRGCGKCIINTVGSFDTYHALIEPSVTYMTVGLRSGGTAPLGKVQGNSVASNGDKFVFDPCRVPVANWEG